SADYRALSVSSWLSATLHHHIILSSPPDIHPAMNRVRGRDTEKGRVIKETHCLPFPESVCIFQDYDVTPIGHPGGALTASAPPQAADNPNPLCRPRLALRMPYQMRKKQVKHSVSAAKQTSSHTTCKTTFSSKGKRPRRRRPSGGD
ncbi:hypothetical protein KUCAC02_010608, partial [Chaenocephalus aceratus]